MKYRDQIFKYYAAKSVHVGPDAKKALTQAHVIYLCRELHDGTGIKYALAGTDSPLAKIDLVPRKQPVVKFLSHESWLGSKIRKIPLLAPNSWPGRKIRKIMGRGNLVEFTSQSMNFRSRQVVRALLTDEMIADLSRYIQTSDRL